MIKRSVSRHSTVSRTVLSFLKRPACVSSSRGFSVTKCTSPFAHIPSSPFAHIPRRFSTAPGPHRKQRAELDHQYPVSLDSEAVLGPALSKGLLDTTLSCTTIDENGNVTKVSESIPKARFLSENKLYARDLRSIDRTPVSIIPCILVRDESILVNLLHIKAMIKYNKVLVFDTHDAKNNSKLSLFMYDLGSKLETPLDEAGNSEGHAHAAASGTKPPFEMKALESILMNVVSTLETEMKAHVIIVNEILASLEDHIDRDQLKELLIRNKALSKFHQKSLLIRNVINDLLDNDEDLVGIYLTEKHEIGAAAVATKPATLANDSHIPTSAHPTRSLDDHADVELLFESYYNQCEEIVQQAGQIITNVKNTEDIINIILDANRNSLMLMELKVTIGTLGFTTGMFFASLYGMNLENFIEESAYGFGGVTGAIVVVAAAVTVYNFRQLQRVRRVTMSGTGISQKLAECSGAYKPQVGKSDGGDTIWTVAYRLWHGRAAERALRKRMWRARTAMSAHDSRRRDVAWRWLVESSGGFTNANGPATSKEGSFTNEQPVDSFSKGEGSFTNEQPVDSFSKGEGSFTNEQPVDSFSKGEGSFTNEQPVDSFSKGEGSFTNGQPVDSFSKGEGSFTNEQPVDSLSKGEGSFTNEQPVDSFSKGDDSLNKANSIHKKNTQP